MSKAENTVIKFVETFVNSLFSIDSKTEFDKMALDAFHFQYENNLVYKKYADLLHINPSMVDEIGRIPFLPISFYKSHKIISGKAKEDIIFTSSGTTGSIQSRHFVSDLSLYEKSYQETFRYFYGNIEDYCILALLPSYLEREGSSLVYMVDDLIKKSLNSNSGFFLYNTGELIERLKILHEKGKKIILIGVSYALLDLIEENKISIPNAIIMETGGMKGKRKELIKKELHHQLCNGFSVEHIHSEYGMTELLSQAYSKGSGIYRCPPWMKVMIRDIHAPSYILGKNETGGINIIDLANINSCCFIETQDLGSVFEDGSFEIIGRMDDSDIRGCNLLVV